MAKGTSFAEKAQRGAKKNDKKFTVVKYVKSVVAEKSGAIRFQESMLKVPEDKNLDSYLKELEAGPVEEKIEVEQVDSEAATEDAPAEEAPVEAAEVEEAPTEDAPAEEAPVEASEVEEAPAEDAPPEEAPVEAAEVSEKETTEEAEPKEKSES